MPSFPNYRILEKAYEGGFSVIYHAWDEEEGREVALKVLLPHWQDNREALQDFIREGEILLSLDHPHIVKVFKLEKGPAIIMEWVEGRNLKRLLLRKRDELLHSFFPLVWKIAEALNYLHNRGIIHGDVKPENILVGKKGEIKLIDFGLARMKGRLLHPKKLRGTPVYLAPEVIASRRLTEKADVFSFGVILYEILCGRLPYQAQDVPTLLRKGVDERVRPYPPSFLSPSIPQGLDNLVLKAIDKEPRNRPSMAEIMLDLARIALGKISQRIEWGRSYEL